LIIVDLAKLIDHTLLRPDATGADIGKLCEEAVRYGFHAVCVSPYFVETAAQALRGSGVGVCTVIGFPLGIAITDVKVYEARMASLAGASELDIVINIGAAKSGDWITVERDIRDIVAATGGLTHKVILEACYLEKDEKTRAAMAALAAGAGFVKTSTGFGTGGATAEDVRLLKEVVGDRAGIKAAGGIKTLAQVNEMLREGATRIGTSSAPRILEEAYRI
jgi:deoxyribose-phosphate aldolase